ncbi:MAG TPA: SdpI family protein [Patescibacteria group bacterium]|nr:SdpI family protein [Patescibacteria group bacterium]
MPEELSPKGIKLTLKSEVLPFLMIITAIIISIVSYKLLPEQVVTHWNISGEPDGWSSRNFYTIFFPGILVFIYLLMNILPKIDPNKKRYAEFANVYLILRNILILTFLIIYSAATLSNIGYDINIGGIVSATIGILFIILGNYLGKIKRNWFIGIRTPWTISSENSWNKTHRLGGKLFIILGLITLLIPAFWPQAAFWFLICGSFALIITITVYSYIIYKKDKSKLK